MSDKPKKPTTKDTNAPYTFKRGDVVTFDYIIKGNKCGPGRGVVVLAAGEQGMQRNTIAIWAGERIHDNRFLLHEALTSNVKLLNLIDNMQYSESSYE